MYYPRESFLVDSGTAAVAFSLYPVRVSDLTVSSRKEGNDDLTFVVGVSTIFLAPEADKSRTATAMAREVLP